MGFQQAFDNFMNKEFEFAVDSATEASWGGSGYSVELFEDGYYCILWDGEIGNLYESPGIILGVPPLTDEEWDDDPTLRFYGNAEEAMQNSFEEAME